VVEAFAFTLPGLALDVAINPAQPLQARSSHIGHFAPTNDLVLGRLSLSFDFRVRRSPARIITALLGRLTHKTGRSA
jgi:hypothetical protein